MQFDGLDESRQRVAAIYAAVQRPGKLRETLRDLAAQPHTYSDENSGNPSSPTADTVPLPAPPVNERATRRVAVAHEIDSGVSSFVA
jgi:hypothetical protein